MYANNSVEIRAFRSLHCRHGATPCTLAQAVSSHLFTKLPGGVRKYLRHWVTGRVKFGHGRLCQTKSSGERSVMHFLVGSLESATAGMRIPSLLSPFLLPNVLVHRKLTLRI